MSWNIEAIEELKGYMTGVLGRADHHAKEASEIVFVLTGAIIYYADDDSPIVVREGRNTEIRANQLRVQIKGKKYVFSWSHEDKAILVKEKNQQGAIIQRFSNSSSNSEVKAFFEPLN